MSTDVILRILGFLMICFVAQEVLCAIWEAFTNRRQRAEAEAKLARLEQMLGEADLEKRLKAKEPAA
jgi:hypothetical protein